jgi:hypothetical protein
MYWWIAETGLYRFSSGAWSGSWGVTQVISVLLGERTGRAGPLLCRCLRKFAGVYLAERSLTKLLAFFWFVCLYVSFVIFRTFVNFWSFSVISFMMFHLPFMMNSFFSRFFSCFLFIS